MLDNAWRGAAAYHYYLLAQRQLYNGKMDAAMKTSIRLAEYEDVLDPKDIYSLVALTAYHNSYFGICSRAFIKLETMTGIEDEERETIQNLALQIFTKNPPLDPHQVWPWCACACLCACVPNGSVLGHLFFGRHNAPFALPSSGPAAPAPRTVPGLPRHGNLLLRVHCQRSPHCNGLGEELHHVPHVPPLRPREGDPECQQLPVVSCFIAVMWQAVVQS